MKQEAVRIEPVVADAPAVVDAPTSTAVSLSAPARDLHQRLITNVRDSIAAWEDWKQSLTEGPTKTFHDFALRLTKGVVKAWRVWLTQTK